MDMGRANVRALLCIPFCLQMGEAYLLPSYLFLTLLTLPSSPPPPPQDGVEENNWLEHNFAGYIHVIGKPAGGPEQTGTLHIQVRGDGGGRRGGGEEGEGWRG